MGFEINFLGPKVKVENTFVLNTKLWTADDKLIMAPMHAITNYVFRNSFDKVFPEAIDKAITPFISLTHGNLTFNKRKYSDILIENNTSSFDIIPQVLGNDPKGIIDLCEISSQLGYREVNWNIGCPQDRIMNKDRGAGLLRDTDRIEKILSEVLDNIDINFSIKIRLGKSSKEDISRLIPIINQYPISNVIIHPRLAIDKYEKEVDLDSFEESAKLINKRIIYNGDIFSKEDFNKLKLRFPNINDWMIGRGLLFNPCLASEIKSINYIDKKERLLALHSELIREGVSLNKLKGCWSYFLFGLNWQEDKTKILFNCKTIEDFDKFVGDNIYD
ncbi:MAG: tRNA-dihydrouridine synthase family protein [Bacteroidales bacterium]|nr:tRNA-dihydrouridine synthase family protein [Bacteroidales bacterium]